MLGGGAVNRILVQVRGDSKQLQGEMKKANEAVAASAAKFKQAGAVMMAAGAAITAAFVKTTMSTIAYGERLDKASKITGLTAEEFAKLAYAAEQEHASLEALEKGLVALTSQIGEAGRGLATFTDLFDELEVEYRKADGTLRDTYDVFLDLADVMSKGAVTTEQSSALFKLLGRRAGKELKPMLMLGRDWFVKMGLEAGNLGKVLSNETVIALKRTSDEITAMKTGVKGIMFSLGAELAPVLESVTSRITELTKKYHSLTDEKKSLIAKIGALTGAFGLLGGAALLFIGYIPSIIAGLKTIRLAVIALNTKLKITKGLLALLAGPKGWAVLAGVGVAAGIRAVIRRQREATEEVRRLTEELKTLEFQYEMTGKGAEELAVKTEELTEAKKRLVVVELEAEVERMRRRVANLTAELKYLGMGYDEIGKATKETKSDELADAFTRLKELTEKLREKKGELREEVKDLGGEMTNLGGEIEEVGDKIMTLADKFEEAGIKTSEEYERQIAEYEHWLQVMLEAGQKYTIEYAQLMEKKLELEKEYAEKRKDILWPELREPEIERIRPEIPPVDLEGWGKQMKEMEDISRDSFEKIGEAMNEILGDAFEMMAMNYARELSDSIWGAQREFSCSFEKILDDFKRMVTQMMIKYAILTAMRLAGLPVMEKGGILGMAKGGIVPAQYGIVTKPTFLVGERGAELIAPLDTFWQKLEGYLGQDREINITIKHDGLVSLRDEEVADEVYRLATRPAQARFEERVYDE